jgi:hypothetical protein
VQAANDSAISNRIRLWLILFISEIEVKGDAGQYAEKIGFLCYCLLGIVRILAEIDGPGVFTSIGIVQ